jgi:hypothetical protein
MLHNCPKTFPVEGLSSVSFIATIQSTLEGKHDDRLFVDAILSDLMDCLGEDFHVAISPLKYSPGCCHIVIRYKEYRWLADFACNMDAFQQKTQPILKVLGVSLYTGQSEGNTGYSFIAKKGVYEEIIGDSDIEQ